uniref:Immunoglobulin V-set domain-containing protein n=1 Tax=Zosterops lateralis melanops TaxID=1220523 RepID=A0A8D2PXF2_ZOSLA
IFWSLFLPLRCLSLLHLLDEKPGKPHILTQTNNKTEILCELKKENNGVYWYRWSQEKQHFEFLVFSNTLGKATYGTNVSQDRFSVHEARSQSSYSLHISRLHPSDSGTYYYHPSQKILKWDLFLRAHNPLSLSRSKQK